MQMQRGAQKREDRMTAVKSLEKASLFAAPKKKPSYADQAYEAIKELILEEQIEAGSMLSENGIAEFLNMSRTPIREAINRLQAEGLLESIKGVGTFLKPHRPKDIRDIYRVRIALELLACETAIGQATTEEIDALETKLRALLEQDKKGEAIDRLAFSKIDGAVHNLIIARSNNEYIQLLMNQINFNVDRYRTISFHLSMDVQESTQQHLTILECMKRRDIEGMKRELEAHLKWSLQLIMERLE